MNRILSQITIWLALLLCGLLPLKLNAQDVTVSGTLDVTGTILSMGTLSGTATYPGWQMNYLDGTASAISFEAGRSVNTWQWFQNAAEAPALQMSLNGSNTLILYDASGTPAITLNPLGASTFANSLAVTGTLTVSGTNNLMPNQTLTGTASVMTEGLADARYLTGSSNLELPTQTLNDPNSVLTEALADALYVHPDSDGNVVLPTGSVLIQGSTAVGDFATFGDASYFNNIQDTKFLVADNSGATFSNDQFDSGTSSARSSLIVSNSSDGYWYDNCGFIAVHGLDFPYAFYPTATNATSDGGKGMLMFEDNSGLILKEVQLGSPDGVPVSLVSNNSLVATCTPDGNFGVGTSTPVAKLEVNGDSQTDGNDTVCGTLTVTGTGGFMTTATSVSSSDIPMFGH